METLFVILNIVACVLLFSFTIAIHEFGHFIVALKLGLRVEAFSIGFGPALWKRKYHGVEYRLSAIPLGGYVSIPDVDPEGTKALEGGASAADATAVIPAWKEICVAFAGPFMNIVLAVVLACALACVPSARFGELPPVIGHVVEGGPAAVGGLQAGDTVLAVGDHPVRTWTEMQTETQIAGGRSTIFTVRGADGLERALTIMPERHEASGIWLIKALSETNDVCAASWMPARSPLRQLAWDAGSIFRVLKGLVTPKEVKATAGALGGPVLIAEAIYGSMRRSVWDGFGFVRFLNVNLAILNLLPIPVLDGGLILFALIALVMRRRVPAKFVKTISIGFTYLLMTLMAVLILKDSWRSYKLHTWKAPTTAVEATTNDLTNTDSSN